MANEGFNGSTITLAGSAETPLISIEFTEAGAEVDVTGCADAMHSYEAGLPNPTITVEVVGGTTLVVGSNGALSISFFDGTTKTISDVVVTNVSIRGNLDGAITSTITARPGSGVGTGT